MAELVDGSGHDLGRRRHGLGAGGELFARLVELGFEASDYGWIAVFDGGGDPNAGGFDEPPVQLVLGVVFTMQREHGDAEHGALCGQMIAGRTDGGPASAQGFGEGADVGRHQVNSGGHAARLTKQPHAVTSTRKELERVGSVAIPKISQNEVLSGQLWIDVTAKIGTRYEGGFGARFDGREVDRYSTAGWPRRAGDIERFAQVTAPGQCLGETRVMQNQTVPDRHDGDAEGLGGVDRGAVTVAHDQVGTPTPKPLPIGAEPQTKRTDHPLAGHAGQDGLRDWEVP